MSLFLATDNRKLQLSVEYFTDNSKPWLSVDKDTDNNYSQLSVKILQTTVNQGCL